MKILMYGVSNETVSSEDIDKYTIDNRTKSKQIKEIIHFPGVSEVTLLSTEIRNEYYLYVDENVFKHGDLLRYLSDYTGKPLKEIILETYSKFNEDAIRHLYSVTCGMEALSKGSLNALEASEFALKLGEKNHTVSGLVRELFCSAIDYAYKIRRSNLNAILEEDSSKGLAYLKQEEIELIGKNILVIGDSFQVQFLNKALFQEGVNSVTVANKTLKQSLDIAQCFDGTAFEKYIYPIAFKNAAYRFSAADVIVICNEDSQKLLTDEFLYETTQLRQSKKRQVILDLCDCLNDYVNDFEEMQFISYDKFSFIKCSDKEKEKSLEVYDESLSIEAERFMKTYFQVSNKKNKVIS